MKILIIQIKKGGLGDHLFFSHLPRIAKQTGAYDKVFLSNQSECRHPDTIELIWKLNPWLDGFTDQRGEYYFPVNVNESKNLLDAIMLAYGLEDGLRFHEPEIYYTPNLMTNLECTLVYDPNYISFTGKLRTGKKIEDWFKQKNIQVDYQMANLKNRTLTIDSIDNVISTTNLFELCDLIFSCKRVYCLTTGTATLAAALGKSVTVFYGTGHDQLYRHSKLHQYENLGTDYTIKNQLFYYFTLFLQKLITIGKR
jgi:hypothetical protein